MFSFLLKENQQKQENKQMQIVMRNIVLFRVSRPSAE